MAPTVSHVNASGNVHVGAWRDGNGVDHVSRVYFAFDLPSQGLGLQLSYSNNLLGATDFTYAIDNGPEQTVTIGDTGSTPVSITPSAGYHWITVYSRRPDGLTSTVQTFIFIV